LYTQAATVTGGTLTVAPGATGTLDQSRGNGLTLVGATLVNRGTLTTTTDTAAGYSDAIRLAQASLIDNRGTLLLTDQVVMTKDATQGSLLNDAGGTIAYQGTGTAELRLPFTNDGSTAAAGGGTLFVYRDGPAGADAGSFSADAGSTISFQGNRSLQGTNAWSGSGTLAIGPTATLRAAATLTVADLQLAGGTYAGSATVTSSAWLAGGRLVGPGSLTLVVGAVGTLGGSTSVSLTLTNGYHLVNDGTLTTTTNLSSGVVTTVVFTDGATLENAGTLNMTDYAQFVALDKTADAMVNDAAATVSYVGSARAWITVPFSNQGSASVSGSSTLELGPGIGMDSGTYLTAAGSTLDVTGARTLGASAAIDSSGLLTIGSGGALASMSPVAVPSFSLAGGTFRGSLTATNDLQLATGTLAGGTVMLSAGGSGTLGSIGGTLTLAGGERLRNLGSLATVPAPGAGPRIRLVGSSTLENASNLTLADGAQVTADTSGDVLVNDAGATVAYAGTTWATVDAPFDNVGTLMMSGAGGLRLGDLTNLVSGTLTGGTYAVDSGRLVLPSTVTVNAATVTVGTKALIRTAGLGAFRSLTQNAGSLTVVGTLTVDSSVLNTGTLTVATGGVLDVGGFSQGVGGATTVATGATLQSDRLATRAIDLTGGTLTGNGTLGGVVTTAGAVVQPGQAAGPLVVSGTDTMGPGSTLSIGVYGPSAPGTDFGQLSVTGKATVGGTLVISTATGFQPATGATYEIVTSAARVGRFSKVTGTTLPGGHHYAVSYGPTGVYLTVR